MTVTINGYEVEIKAKRIGEARVNKEDTMHVMNYLSILAGEASERYSLIGMTGLQKEAEKTRDSIFNLLDSKGAYKDCKY